MLKSYFSIDQIVELSLIGVLYLISLYCFVFKQNFKLSLIWLFVAGLTSRLVVISLDPFFHQWDEQYHALVAQNMAQHPFTPMLYKYTPLPYNPDSWVANHIWLHKQPLFLWQIALFIKLFGSSVFVVRLPSAIMSALLIPVVFRMGQLTLNKTVGFIACFLYATSNYLIDFNTGIYATDHNDVAFIFYVTLSIWAYTEYSILNKKNYLWLIGLFAGLAILNKWVVGLTVYAGWGATILFLAGKENKISELKNIGKSLLVCFLTVLPWQIYILIAFPRESRYEYAYNSLHFFEALEHHAGDAWYHFNLVPGQYGTLAAYLLPLALFIFFLTIKNVSARISYITFVVVVYLFFTISKTKMPAFCLILAPVMFIALGNFIVIILDHLSKKENNMFIKTVVFIILLIIGGANFNVEKIQALHTDWVPTNSYNQIKKEKVRIETIAKKIRDKYDSQKTVVFNCGENNNTPMMFFSGYIAYDNAPTKENVELLKRNGFTILYIDNYSFIPEYIKNDATIIKIPASSEVKSCHLEAANKRYLCVDKNADNIVNANCFSLTQNSFSIIIFENTECVIRDSDGKYFSPELLDKEQIKSNRDAPQAWEVFNLIKLENNMVAFKAFNGKYLTVDKKSGQLFARAVSISAQEKFELINKQD
jgi:hypothetical protein